MRKFMIGVAAAVSTLALAAPASAQWAIPTYQYQQYNYGRGFNGLNFAHSMASRVQRIRSDIHMMDQRRILSNQEARRLDREARRLQDRIYRASRNGINPYEARSVENGIRQLERHVAREASDWDRRARHGRRY